uniref:BEN domain protein n=1 Tax=Cotesia sesamiae Mombasa bracovirus TaxID=452649 RepID=R9XL46_9VIRU|nr:BEN domain protein [Cotesia sesamiae Mombasa bracovirus]
MDESQKCYYMVKFMSTKNMEGSEVHCVPVSWIVWEDSESSTVLVAYPNEPWEVTKERVKNYENREKDWLFCLAKIMYRTDFYDSVICCVNQREDSAEEYVSSVTTATKFRSPYNSYSEKFEKWLGRLTTETNSDYSTETAMEKVPKVQSDPSESAIVLDSDDDTPWHLSTCSSESRSNSEYGTSTEEVYCPEVIITKVGSSDSPSAPSNRWKICGVNDSNTFWSNIERLFSNPSNSGDLELSMASQIDEVAKSQQEESSINIDQAIEDGTDGEVSRDWAINSSEVDEQLGATNLLKDAPVNPGGNDIRWTLKHHEWAPGLVELFPNTGVYIKDSELNFCLRRSIRCTQLTRLLTKHIFTESALNKCRYVKKKQRGYNSLQLDSGAVTAIINFVQTYGYRHNWRPSSKKSIIAAMRYQLILAKKIAVY